MSFLREVVGWYLGPTEICLLSSALSRGVQHPQEARTSGLSTPAAEGERPQRERETERQKQRQREGETQTERWRQTETETETVRGGDTRRDGDRDRETAKEK